MTFLEANIDDKLHDLGFVSKYLYIAQKAKYMI